MLIRCVDTFEVKARMLSTIQCYQDEGKRIVSRRYPDGKSDCAVHSREKFLIETYNVVLVLCFASAEG